MLTSELHNIRWTGQSVISELNVQKQTQTHSHTNRTSKTGVDC